MNTIAQQTLDTIKIVVLAAMLVLGMQYVFASPPAGATPPACPAGQPGCDPPVNVGGSEQEKTGLLNVGGLVSRYGITVQGDIIASNINAAAGTFSGIVSGSSLSVGSGAITGGSLNIGSGLVTAGDGVTAAVAVGTNNNSARTYLKIDAENFGGTKPPASDCAGEPDYGKMIFSFNQSYIYICGFDVVESAPAWWYAPLTLQLP